MKIRFEDGLYNVYEQRARMFGYRLMFDEGPLLEQFESFKEAKEYVRLRKGLLKEKEERYKRDIEEYTRDMEEVGRVNEELARRARQGKKEEWR